MQFLVTGFDGADEGAQARRTAARTAHLALGDQMRDRGELLYGVALLNDSGQMVGSVMVLEMESRQKLDEWLAIEPYVTGKVWARFEIKPCRVGPSFSR